MKKNGFRFRVNVETNDRTGEIMAVYFKLRDGVSHRAKEYHDGNVFADYDRRGQLLGIELLAPCEVRVLTKIAVEAPAKKFLREAIPKGMLVTA